jgi:hypothetical protein
MKKKLDSSHEPIKQVEIDELFSQITTHEVEQFYHTYHLWLKQQQIMSVQQEIHNLKEKQAQNAVLLNTTTPSAVALAALAQLRASGVEEIDLLDRMLERGEEWLDHTMQLLERCEELNVIRGNYTQWCEHALDGAYEWMGSMDDASLHDYFHTESTDIPSHPSQPLIDLNPADTVTEDQLLLKLMSDEDNITNTIAKTKTVPLERITQKLPPLISNEDEDEDSLDFPVEIEEPETASVESDVDSVMLSQLTDEQFADQEDKQPDEQAACMELFPVEIEEPVSATSTSTEQELLASEDTDTETEKQHPDEVQEAAVQTEVHADIASDTTTEILDDAPDEQVLSIEQSEEVELVELEMTTLEVETNEQHANSQDDSSTPTETETEAEIQIDHLVETTSPPSETSQNEEAPVLVADPTSELIDTQLPTQEPDDIPEPMLNTQIPMPEPDDLPASVLNAQLSTPEPDDILASALNIQLPMQESTDILELAIKTQLSTQEPDDILGSMTNTTADATTDSVEENEDKSSDQWPFAYQEMEETPIEAATYSETISHEDGSDAEQHPVDPALKKPQDEAFSESSTKKQSWIGHLLLNLLRR